MEKLFFVTTFFALFFISNGKTNNLVPEKLWHIKNHCADLKFDLGYNSIIEKKIIGSKNYWTFAIPNFNITCRK
jgi:hypothetical protein